MADEKWRQKMIITKRLLQAKGACEDQVRVFAEIFPHGSPATKEEALAAALAHAKLFDWNWAANRLLSESTRQVYAEAVAPARQAYTETEAIAWREFIEAEAAARQVYGEAKASTRPAYDEAVASAWRAYVEAVAPTCQAYDEARASAFVNAAFQEA